MKHHIFQLKVVSQKKNQAFYQRKYSYCPQKLMKAIRKDFNDAYKNTRHILVYILIQDLLRRYNIM